METLLDEVVGEEDGRLDGGGAGVDGQIEKGLNDQSC